MSCRLWLPHCYGTFQRLAFTHLDRDCRTIRVPANTLSGVGHISPATSDGNRPVSLCVRVAEMGRLPGVVTTMP